MYCRFLSVNLKGESVHVSTQHDGGARNAGINDAEDTIRVSNPMSLNADFFKVIENVLRGVFGVESQLGKRMKLAPQLGGIEKFPS